MDSPTGDFIKSSAAYTSHEFSAMEKQQQEFSSQFFQDLQQQQAQAQEEQQQQQQQQQRKPQTRPRRSPKSSSSAYSAWARTQAMASVYILVAGGALCLIFPGWLPGAYSIALGILVYSIERKPSSNQSSTEGPPHAGKILSSSTLSPSKVLKAHSIRSTFYIIASVPCFLRAPNYTGGLCLITSGLTYAVAAFLANRKSKGKGKSPSMSPASYR
ncbi:hypothetical protein KI688_001511 [Linnemannia hyalina]|uniref:p22-phox n=1 Tax=Linnemannia hyalina TaxID=64524 RepID=A0A9P7XS29_9FUNG|nr:hypothetical protein KI688_001511 [Linnemannia hyalina]